jgi:transketolase
MTTINLPETSAVVDLERDAVQLRRSLLRVIREANAGHTGGGLSCLDVLNVLYSRVLNVSPATAQHPDRDRYIQSKGHCAEALYVVLARHGFIPEEELSTICRFGSRLGGHPTQKIPGVEQATGALGHGLSISVGMALAAKLDNRPYRVFTLLGDGELAEGSNWEAALAASHYGLDNLVAIVDRNGLQISGTTEAICALEPLEEKWQAFGFSVRNVDGHDYRALLEVFEEVPFTRGKPNLIIANTVKGKGISFMEHVARWHHGVPSEDEYAAALSELDEIEARLR